MFDKRKTDLGDWHHGASNNVECMGSTNGDYLDADGFLTEGTTDRSALTIARKHVASTGHIVEVSRTIFRSVFPMAATT